MSHTITPPARGPALTRAAATPAFDDSSAIRPGREGCEPKLDSFVAEDSGWGLSFQIHRHGRPERRMPGSVSWMGWLNTFYWIDPAAQVTGVFATQVEPLLDRETVIAFARFERAVHEALS